MKIDPKKIQLQIKNFNQYIKVDIWKENLDDMPKRKAFWVRILKVILLAMRGFNEHDVQVRGSSLTFYTLLSIVPVMAMAFGVAKGFGLEKMLQEELTRAFEGHEEILTYSIEFANSMLENARGGFIAGIGLVVLFWSIIQLLNSIESSFNKIWGVKRPRIFVRKFTDYFAIMFVAPVLLIVSSSVTVYITTQIQTMVDTVGNDVQQIQIVTPFIHKMLQVVSYSLIWLLLTLIYMVMPNTKVNFMAALIAGIIAGTAYQITQWGYINFQIGVSRTNAIYGSFAAFPLFLVWLQVSWLIILFGAEIAFAYQNVKKYHFDSDSLKMSVTYKRLLALLITHDIVKNFAYGNNPLSAYELSQKLKIPSVFVREIIDDLLRAKILAQTLEDDSKEISYHPAFDINQITVVQVVQSIESLGMNGLKLDETPQLQELQTALQSFDEHIRKMPHNKLLKDI